MGILFGTKTKFFYYRNWARNHTIEAGLVVEVYACSKIKIRAPIGAATGILNSVTPKRKIETFDNFSHAKNRQGNNKKNPHV